MKTWMKYEPYLLSGEWHIHTSHTDGANTVADYCRKASEEGVSLLAFTEHVRKTLDYNFRDLLEEIERAKVEFNLIILSGCEVKVLPGGELDVAPDILETVDYPVLAFHSFPKDIREYTKSLKFALINPYVNTWAHPGLFLTRNNLEISDEELTGIFRLMKQNDVLLEVNSKYGMPPAKWLEMAKRLDIRMVRGGDIHRVDTMSRSKAIKL